MSLLSLSVKTVLSDLSFAKADKTKVVNVLKQSVSKGRVCMVRLSYDIPNCMLRLDRYSRALRTRLANAETKNLYKFTIDGEKLWTVRTLDLAFQAVLKKINEKASELVLAVRCECDNSVCREAADMIYYALLLLRVLGLDLAVLVGMLKLRAG